MIEVYSSRVSMCRFVVPVLRNDLSSCGILWRRQWFIQHCLAGQCGDGLEYCFFERTFWTAGCSLRLSCKLMSCNSCGLWPFMLKFTRVDWAMNLDEGSSLWKVKWPRWRRIRHCWIAHSAAFPIQTCWGVSVSTTGGSGGCFCLALIVQLQQPKEWKVDLNWREASLARIPSVSS